MPIRLHGWQLTYLLSHTNECTSWSCLLPRSLGILPELGLGLTGLGGWMSRMDGADDFVFGSAVVGLLGTYLSQVRSG